MNISQQVVILSAENTKLTPEQNCQRTKILKHCLEDCNLLFGESLGMYKGEPETSFVVIINNSHDLQALKDFAFKNFNQESILYQDANQEAHLIFNNGAEERLGRLEEVTEEEARKHNAFTLFSGRYYVTKQRQLGH
jgi:hypothetical protein